MPLRATCPVCGQALATIYRAPGVPVDAVRLYADQPRALACPRGTLALGICASCEFISNAAFDPSLVTYGPGYKPSQASSPLFNEFHRQLAAKFVDQYGIRNRHILEIGCGEGEFLFLLASLGDNRCVGFDPACRPVASEQVTLVDEWFAPERYAGPADLVCSKMTLEHVPDVRRFVQDAKAAARNPQTLFFFQVPDVRRILVEAAFWDLYYEHCSYFSRKSLVALFERCGLAVIDLWSDFGSQYLMLVARIGGPDRAGRTADEDSLLPLAGTLQARCEDAIARHRALIDDGGRTALWGGGSKGMAFAAALGPSAGIAYAIDIDPDKRGHYLPGSGLQIQPPEILRFQPVDRIIVMNPCYRGEIEAILASLQVSARLILPGESCSDARSGSQG